MSYSTTLSNDGSEFDVRHSPLYPIPTFGRPANVDGLDAYERLYLESIGDRESFWRTRALEDLSWAKPFKTVLGGEFPRGTARWFPDGQLNASYNCLDRHDPNKIALMWESDEQGTGKEMTFGELKTLTCKLANYLSSISVKSGDVVTIYMPMVPEAVVSILACARIGAIHNVVFAGFSAESLRGRIVDSGSKLIIAASEGVRGGKTLPLGSIAKSATKGLSDVNILWFRRTQSEFAAAQGSWWHDVVPKQPDTFEPVPMNGDSPLFMLYTSGSTGKPKGLIHSTAGYLLYAMTTARLTFDLKEGDRFGCLADIGWITGHSYIVYGPLANGVSTLLFEGTPFYPDYSRYWELVDRLRLTQIYTAPTVLRALKKAGNDPVEPHSLDTLRVLGSVGEPINPEAWIWYHDIVGRGRCAVVDTYWQTETGGHVLTPLPGAIKTKAGSAAKPFLGIEPVIIDATSGSELHGNSVSGVLAIKAPWPGMAMTIFGDHEKFLQTYLAVYPGVYFTGDRAHRDAHGYYWVQGRVDDVLNVSGHRISTAEIEAAVCRSHVCSEAAALGRPDDVTGQAVWVFCCIKDAPGEKAEAALIKAALKNEVRLAIGPFATPAEIVLVEDLPKTRSGKIMRRVLRKLLEGQADSLGDLSTLNNPHIVPLIDSLVREALQERSQK